MELTDKHFFEGKKRLKGLKSGAKKRAKELFRLILAQDLMRLELSGGSLEKSDEDHLNEVRDDLESASDDVLKEMADAQAMFQTHHTLKEKQLQSAIVAQGGLKSLRQWFGVLVLDVPRGVPNLIGVPGQISSEDDAMSAMKSLLTAAYVKIEETKWMIRMGQITPETRDLRLFAYQDLFMQVPGEFVDAAASEVQDLSPGKELNKIKGQHIDDLVRMVGHQKLTDIVWAGFTEDQKVTILQQAARLLCLNVNRV
jgi:hypothetical protein